MPQAYVNIGIVNYNTRDALASCLSGLQRVSDEAHLTVTVVDNASSDGSAEMVRAQFPDVRLVPNDYNAGFAKGINQAFAHCDAPFFFILNPDTWVGRGAIAKLLKEFEAHGSCAVAGAQLTCFAGERVPSVLAAPTLFKEFWNLLPEVKALLFPRRAVRLVQYLRSANRNQSTSVKIASGAAFMVRSSVFRSLGGFDERFYLYHEEVDFCLRALAEGHTVRFVPGAQVLHHDALASGFRANSLPGEPVLGWRTMGKWLLFAKHDSASKRRRFARLAGIMLRLRAGWYDWVSRFTLAGRDQMRRRATEYRQVAARLEGREYLQNVARNPEVSQS